MTGSRATPDPLLERAEDLSRSTELLAAELPDRRFVDTDYLRWLYDQNPAGRSYEASIDADGQRIGHYALVPQTYRDASGPARFVFSLNAVTRSGGQRRGLFQQLGAQVYAEAADDGIRVVVGVSNANSTPPVVRRMGWRLLGPLPVRVARARRPQPGWTSASASATVAGDRWQEVVGQLDRHQAFAWTNVWSPEALGWRLRAPNSAPYAVHIGADLVCVSTTDHAGPVPMTVILKLLPRRRGPVDGAPAVAAACAHHRTPAAIYAGWNRHVVVPGTPVPTRLRPVPLNLIVRSLDPTIRQEQFQLDTFEFLDMDAY